ncbi:hypothetical protein L596_018640 [Steinernema carpocapsae]|uniref:Secreted protein n=1 Tax=Steinernema carpocapsae TaxID=34508 RepID=A0A4U5N6A6_STECR|nr:hypothetical protein L596_018640 [Steinernema carpocapsae]
MSFDLAIPVLLVLLPFSRGDFFPTPNIRGESECHVQPGRNHGVDRLRSALHGQNLLTGLRECPRVHLLQHDGDAERPLLNPLTPLRHETDQEHPRFSGCRHHREPRLRADG